MRVIRCAWLGVRELSLHRDTRDVTRASELVAADVLVAVDDAMGRTAQRPKRNDGPSRASRCDTTSANATARGRSPTSPNMRRAYVVRHAS